MEGKRRVVVPGTRPALGRRAARALVVLAVVLAGAAAPVGGVGTADLDPTSTTAGAVATPPAETPLSVSVERSGSTVRYRATVTAPENAEHVRLGGAFGLLNVTRSDGFRAVEHGYRLREGRDRGTLVVAVDLDESRSTPLGRVGPDGPFQAGDGWAFAPSPRFGLSWTVNGTTAERRLAAGAAEKGASVPLDADGSVAVGDRFVYLGAHTVDQRDGTRLIVPRAASFDVGADRALSLAASTYREAGTDPDGPVTAFVLPREVRAGGAASGTDLWVRADATERTVAHEFAHAAVSLRTTERTRWLGEAAAEYVAYRTVGPADVTGTLLARVVQPDAVLADRDSWGSDAVAYRKGAAVLALLDERVRATSDGERSIRSVLAELSAAERVDAETLRAVVVAAADEPTAVWLTEHATGEATFDAVAEDDSARTPGVARRFPGVDGAGWASPTAVTGLLAALGAVVLIFWVIARCCYRAFGLLRSRVAV